MSGPDCMQQLNSLFSDGVMSVWSGHGRQGHSLKCVLPVYLHFMEMDERMPEYGLVALNIVAPRSHYVHYCANNNVFPNLNIHHQKSGIGSRRPLEYYCDRPSTDEADIRLSCETQMVDPAINTKSQSESQNPLNLKC